MLPAAARRIGLALLAVLALAADGAGAGAGPGKSCSGFCRERSRACRAQCVKAGGTSDEQMACRSGCVEDEDECRCGCGDRAYCEGGGKGQKGCAVLVARN